MTKEEVEQFLSLQDRVKELAMQYLTCYSELKGWIQESKSIERIEEIGPETICFEGYDGYEPVVIKMPTRYLYDAVYRSKLIEERAEQLRWAEEKRKSKEEEARERRKEFDRAKFEQLKNEYDW